MKHEKELYKKSIKLLKIKTLEATLFVADQVLEKVINLTDKTAIYIYNKYMRIPVGQMLEWTYNAKMDPLLGIITEHSERGYTVIWNLGHKTKKAEVSIYELREGLIAGNYKLVLDK